MADRTADALHPVEPGRDLLEAGEEGEPFGGEQPGTGEHDPDAGVRTKAGDEGVVAREVARAGEKKDLRRVVGLEARGPGNMARTRSRKRPCTARRRARTAATKAIKRRSSGCRRGGPNAARRGERRAAARAPRELAETTRAPSRPRKFANRIGSAARALTNRRLSQGRRVATRRSRVSPTGSLCRRARSRP